MAFGFFKGSKSDGKRKTVDPSSWANELIKIITKFELEKRRYEFDMPGIDDAALRAFVAPSVYVMLADRARQPEEEVQLLAMLVTSPALRDTTPLRFGEIIKGVIATLREKPATAHEQTMRELLRNMPRGLNESSYAYAVRISYADQLQTEEEKQSLQALQAWMQITPDMAGNIDATMRLLVAAPRII